MKLTAFNHWTRDTRDTIFLLCVIGWIVMPQINHLPWWCSSLTACVLLWRGWIALTARPLPSRWWLLFLLISILAATFFTFRTLLGREPGVTLIVSLLALKTLELRARRDALVVFFLGFFTMLTAFFHSQSLVTAIVMVLALLGLLTALINAHRPVGQPSLKESALLAIKMAAYGAPVMLALFLFFPRFSPLWGLPSDALSGRSGLSGSMKIGNIAELVLDDTVAMRVRFESAEPPRQSALYFRGPVLSRFDGTQWTASSGDFLPDASAGVRDLQVNGPPLRYETTLEPSNRPWLLTLDVTPNAPAVPSSMHAAQTRELQWITSAPLTDLMRYSAESYFDYRYGVTLNDEAAKRQRTQNLRLPLNFNPRTAQLAQELRQAASTGSDDSMRIVEAALERLRTGGYQYTLEPGISGRDSADEFWFETKAGFCEHIASAFVILMRASGVPARIVTGFQGGEMNTVSGHLTVRNSDAHAWAEVWIESQGWIRVDPTAAVAPGRIGQLERLRAPTGVVAGALGALSPTFLARWRDTWDAINNGWNQWVLNYTQDRQLNLLKNIGFKRPSLEDLGSVLAGLLVFASLTGALWAIWERRQRDPWHRLLTRARAQISRAGIDAPTHAPPRELAARVALALDIPEADRSSIREWLLAMEHVRYGRGEGGHRQRLIELKRKFKQINWPRRRNGNSTRSEPL